MDSMVKVFEIYYFRRRRVTQRVNLYEMLTRNNVHILKYNK